MSIPVKIDEPLSQRLAASVAARGYAVKTVIGQGWGGYKDSELWPLLVSEGVFFITADKGFGDVRRYPPGTHKGILVLRPAQESLLDYKALLESVLDKHSLDTLAGCIVVATPRGIRIRRK